MSDKSRWSGGKSVPVDPAYGTSRDPHQFYEATIKVPRYLRQEQWELESILNVCHDALATRIYLLLIAGAEFRSGEIVTNYKRLRALCSPNRPQGGQRKLPWSYWQIRNAVDELARLGLVSRDVSQNEALGELRLYVHPRAPGAVKNARPAKETAGVAAGSAGTNYRGKRA